MKIEVVEEKKNRLVVNFEGANHTVCNILKKELWNDKHIKAAAYSIKHPLIGVPQMTVETDGDEKPKDALLSAVQRLKKVNDRFRKSFSKEVK